MSSELEAYSPRSACAAAMPGQLPSMISAGIPTVLVMGAIFATWLPGGLDEVTGTLSWMGLTLCAWWMAFRSVERSLDRLQDHGWAGLPGRRLGAFAETLPLGILFVCLSLGVYGGLLLISSSVFGARTVQDHGLFVGLLMGPPVLVLAPWVATHALLRCRFHDRPASVALGQAVAQWPLALLRIPGRILGAVPRRQGDRALDWHTVLSPVFHVMVAGPAGLGAATVLGWENPFAPVVPVVVATVHLQHELEVLVDTYAWRECLEEASASREEQEERREEALDPE